MTDHTDEQYREAARRLYKEDGRIEIDDKYAPSRNQDGDPGAYVMAWVWVPDDAAVKE